MKTIESSSQKEPENRLNILDVIWGVIAAMFGVRDHKKHERDFAHGDPVQFIVCGVVFVFLFVISLLWVVELILQK